MRTAGIDLSASPNKTGVAIIEDEGDGVVVTDLSVGASDQDLVEVIQSAERTGIDCPLGWPAAFVDYVSAHRAGGKDLVVHDDRRPLYWRATDEHVMEHAKVRPLIVSADRIAATAMRNAGILAQLTRSGSDVDRSGQTGLVVEVYPAATLKLWGLPHQRYKRQENAETRSALLEAIKEALPWLNFGHHSDLCRAKDDALDAVLCAVMARLALSGKTLPIPDVHTDAAMEEGWIALPAGLPPKA